MLCSQLLQPAQDSNPWAVLPVLDCCCSVLIALSENKNNFQLEWYNFPEVMHFSWWKMRSILKIGMVCLGPDPGLNAFFFFFISSIYPDQRSLRKMPYFPAHFINTYSDSKQILGNVPFNSPERWEAEGWQQKGVSDLPEVMLIASDRGGSPEPQPKAGFPPSSCFSTHSAVFLVRGESDPKGIAGSLPVRWMWRVKDLTHREKGK